MIIDSIAALTDPSTYHASSARRRSRLGRGLAAAAAVGLLGVILVGVQSLQAPEQPTLLPSVAVHDLQDDSLTAVTGQVAEVYGNKFILADPSGRALIETGRAGEGGTLIAAGEVVTVQGRFHRGFMHASLLVHADGRVDELHPPPPHHGHGPHSKGPEGRGPGPDAPRPEALARAEQR